MRYIDFFLQFRSIFRHYTVAPVCREFAVIVVFVSDSPVPQNPNPNNVPFFLLLRFLMSKAQTIL